MLFLGAWLTVHPVFFLSHFCFSKTQGENYTAEIILMLDIFSEKGIQFYTNYKVCRDPYLLRRPNKYLLISSTITNQNVF